MTWALRLHGRTYSRELLLALIAAILAVSGWAFNRAMDHLTETPTVEYCVKWSGEDPKIAIVTIANLSNKDRIANLSFGLVTRSRSPGQFLRANVESPDTHPGNSPPEISSDGHQVVFAVQELQPGGEYLLLATYDGDDTPEFQRLSTEAVAFQFRQCSFTTALIRHQILILVCLGFGALALVVFLVWMVLRGTSRTTTHRQGDKNAS